MDVVIPRAIAPLKGAVRVPGDKSISHRSVLFSAMAEGTSHLTGVLESEDVRSTIKAVQLLGAKVRVLRHDESMFDLEISGWGARGPHCPDVPIDCGNSGTTARLLMGVLAGWAVEAVLTGDTSLSRRPMRRVTEPLIGMGASIETMPGGTMPVKISGRPLTATTFHSPVASAQVKSAVLLAALSAPGTTRVFEPVPSRDHTERMLPAFGVPVRIDAESGEVAVDGPAVLHACDVSVPGDPSSAAFFVAATLLVPGSEVALPGVCINPTRIGFIRVVNRMGADISLVSEPALGSEPIATVVARHTAYLKAVTVTADEVPTLIDELPVLALIATAARGVSRFEGVGELRVKESDRLAAIVEGLTAFGATVSAGDDYLEVSGPTPLTPATIASQGDHRLAMAWAVAGLAASGTTTVEGFEAAGVSYPGFLGHLETLR